MLFCDNPSWIDVRYRYLILEVVVILGEILPWEKLECIL